MTLSKLGTTTEGISNSPMAGEAEKPQYYYLGDDGAPRGPVDVVFLANELSAGRIRADTQIIPQRAADWRPLSVELGGESAIRKLLLRAQKNRPEAAGPRRKDSLRGASVATAILLPPAGIPALVYAARAEQLEKVGDLQGAEKARRRSLLFQRLAWLLITIAALAFALWLRSSTPVAR